MDVTPELVRQLTTLARLETTPDEVHKLQQQLPTILDYVGQLQTSTGSVEGVRDAAARLREDQAQQSAAVTAILDQAPERLEDFWKVSGVFS